MMELLVKIVERAVARGASASQRALRQAPGVGIAFVVVAQEQVADFENQAARAAIADRQLVPGAEAVEQRQARPMKRNVQALCGLPPVRVGNQQIAARRARVSKSSRSPMSTCSIGRFSNAGDAVVVIAVDFAAHFQQPCGQRDTASPARRRWRPSCRRRKSGHPASHPATGCAGAGI